MQAELVALGVLHHDRPRPAIGVLIHDLRAKRNQALGLRRLAILVDVDVQMDAVLACLAFGNPLEEEPGFDAVGSEQAATSRNADRPAIVIMSSAGSRPAPTRWSTSSE